MTTIAAPQEVSFTHNLSSTTPNRETQPSIPFVPFHLVLSPFLLIFFPGPTAPSPNTFYFMNTILKKRHGRQRQGSAMHVCVVFNVWETRLQGEKERKKENKIRGARLCEHSRKKCWKQWKWPASEDCVCTDAGISLLYHCVQRGWDRQPCTSLSLFWIWCCLKIQNCFFRCEIRLGQPVNLSKSFLITSIIWQPQTYSGLTTF